MDKIEFWTESFNGSGFGYGNGYGGGNGYGHGYGDGYGDGFGDGDGEGSGYGNGFGDGDGEGSGYGNGKGYVIGFGYVSENGWGNGFGDGYGNGKGISEFNRHKVYDIDDIPTIIYSLNRKAGIASGAIIEHNSRLVPCFIAKRGGYFSHGEDIHEAVRYAEAKYYENKPLEERIDEFMNEFSTSDRIPAKELFRWHNILTGSCEMGRKQFCEQHGIDLETDSFTIPEFIELTKDSYGSEAIKELEKKKVAVNV